MKEQILKLQALGYSYNKIKETLKCSKSTISYYLGENQKEKTQFRTKKCRYNKLHNIIEDNKKSGPEKKEKIVKIKYCQKCNNIIIGKGRKYCDNCITVKIPRIKLSTLSLKDSLINSTPNNKYTRIRGAARKLFKQELKGSCQFCGYDKHVELCHIKSIASFSENTLLQEINSEKNVLFLCPNCHWEFDKRLISN